MSLVRKTPISGLLILELAIYPIRVYNRYRNVTLIKKKKVKLVSSDIKLEALAPKDDLLPEEGTSFGVYYKSLSSAFSNPKIRNIALSEN